MKSAGNEREQAAAPKRRAFLCFIRLGWLFLMMALGLCSPQTNAAEPVNVAKGRPVKADSIRTQETQPTLAVDGVATDESRWLSAEKPGPHWLEVDLGTQRKLSGAHLYSGWEGISAVKNLELQAWDGQKWTAIAGSARTANTEPALAIEFQTPVTTSKLRLWINDNGTARVAELLLWEAVGQDLPTLGAGVGPTSHPVMVNQIGYNLDWPKRFTAPLLERGTFTLTAVGSEEVPYRGEVKQGVGDFTDFRPKKFDTEYVITVSGGDLEPGRSDPFHVAPFCLQIACLTPALQFWIDDRGVVGSIPSAMGAAPWRDGPYYNFDTPSLVMLYLANPAFFENMPVEMNWARDKARVTDPAFKLKKPQGPSGDWNSDENALEVVRRYYTELDAPVGERVPDIIQCIHWGIGWWRIKPACFDYADDPAGHRVHPQTIESFAFFLHAYPHMKRYFTEKYYSDMRDFALAQWQPAGLFNVSTNIGTFKGRECPGHSILPNLLMYDVAKRDRLPNAEDFFQAAHAQTKWVVDDLDFNDPRVTKGQRMSEHKLLMGLVVLQREYPDRAPAGLRQKIEQWAQIMIERSDNLWDFRKYDAQNWTLPKNDPSQDNSHGGAGWNEPGNLAGFPALALSVADLLTDKTQARRLREIAVAQFDALFGRNPVGAASPWRMPSDFPGVDRGWPKHFADGICAALETVRGTLNSSASGEHYPFNPKAAFRHPEGWSAFNSAFNVGLAVACQTETTIELADPQTGKALQRVKYGQALLVRLRAPIGSSAREVVLQAETSGGRRGELRLRLTPGTGWEATASVTLADTGESRDGTVVVPKGETLTLSYGLGFMRRAVKWQHDPTSRELRLDPE